MQTISRFRMTGKQHRNIVKMHAGIEPTQVIIGLCGYGTYNSLPASYSLTEKIYVGTAELIKPFIGQLKENQALAVFHYGLSAYQGFLENDEKFFSLIGLLSDEKFKCISVILEGNQKCDAFIFIDGHWQLFTITCVGGSDITFRFKEKEGDIPEQSTRTAQTFGKATTSLLSKLTVGVVGISGTGSIVAEQLYRLGVNKLILVDDDIVETKNLNRIMNSTIADAEKKINKAVMFTKAIEKSGLPTSAIALPTVMGNVATIHELSQCDVLFGCMDSIDGRHHLNCLAVFYSIPYFDLGVRLDADGQGGIKEISCAINYLQPDGSSLLSRHIFTPEELSAASLKRSNPDEYRRRLEEKYISGARENSPAVISVNMLAASMAINDMLARLHIYRDDPNDSIEAIRVDLEGLHFIKSECSEPCRLLAKLVGKGDVNPLLDMPAFSEVFK